MTNLRKKTNKKGIPPSPTNKKPPEKVWDMMRRTANDNNPSMLFWFYKILILSLVIFGVIQLLNLFWKT